MEIWGRMFHAENRRRKGPEAGSCLPGLGNMEEAGVAGAGCKGVGGREQGRGK